MRVLRVLWCAILVAAVGAGCAEPPVSPAAPREISAEVGPDGALRFASTADLWAAVEALDAMSPSELDAWEQALGFTSMRRAYAQLAAQLEQATGPERSALLAANAELLDPNSAEPAIRVAAYGYAALIDRRGIMYVDEVVHQVTEDHVYSSIDGDPLTIKQLAAARRPELWADAEDRGVHAVPYTTAGVISSCGSVMSGAKSTSDRRIEYRTRTYTYAVTTPIGYLQQRYRLEMEIWGFKKLLGSWVSYNTTYQLHHFGVEMDVLMVTSYDGVRHRFLYAPASYRIHGLETGEAGYAIISGFLGDMVENVSPADVQAPHFRKLHQETSSRGTGSTRGVMECNYCGDGTCSADVGETASSCRRDCGYCGDGVCYGNETAASCWTDCASPPPPPPCLRVEEPCLPQEV